MAQQTINVGAAPNDGSGDPERTAWTKANANFTELYAVTWSPQGRLTLTSGTPVMMATVGASTSIFYTPYVGELIPLYDGTRFSMTTFSELTTTISNTTKNPAAVGIGEVNDWFVWNDAGTIRVTHGPAWTNNTTRSTGTALIKVKGLWLNNASITNGPAAQRGTYVGTTATGSTATWTFQFGGLAAYGIQAYFGVWNCYNRVDVTTMVQDTISSWTYATADFRAVNGSGAMRASYVAGLVEDGLEAMYSVNMVNGGNASVGIGVDSVTVASGTPGYANIPGLAGGAGPLFGRYMGLAQLGLHYLQAIEWAAASTVFLGTDISSGDTYLQNGLFFSFRL